MIFKSCDGILVFNDALEIFPYLILDVGSLDGALRLFSVKLLMCS